MWHWLTTSGHLYTAIVGWAVGVTMTTALALILKPVRRLKKAWQDHMYVQLTIADLLDTTTPGGNGELLRVMEQKLGPADMGTAP